MKEVLTKSRSNEGDMTYPGHLLSQNEAYSGKAGCYWLKGYNENPQKTQTVVKSICSSKQKASPHY